MILLDSNVLIDLLRNESSWNAWSRAAVANAGAGDDLAISPIVVAEVAPRLGSLDDFLERMDRFGATVAELTNDAAYAAGTAFMRYRERSKAGGEHAKSIIADFLIGGHASTLGATILTRDPRFYRTYFPEVPLITPDEAKP